MKLSRALAVLCAAALAPLALVVPSAQADLRYAGEITDADPLVADHLPDPADRCDPVNGTYAARRTDTVSFVSTTDGPRRILVRTASSLILWVYVNGTCVGGDRYPDDLAEDAAGVIDLDGVPIARGATVQVRIASNTVPAPWTLEILQPGTANAAASGRATRYVVLPEQVTCANATARATFTKKARKAARKGAISTVIFKAGGAKVAKVKTRKVRKAVRKGVLLERIPAGATSIDVVVKLKSGKKRKASRPYSAC
ncbi:hypothetical protein ACJ5H2_12825 [Nocardioides sp. R1-1]|uniref:hypothetical protein n=1 Tax=Nocardioides sp. R1-1 TaxID=3383502 RepID=UPI0038D07D55